MAWAADGTLIIDGVDCVAPAGTVTGLIGPNGSGKSTLLRVLAGLRAPAGGTVMVGDRDLAALSARSRARVIAAVEQAPQPAAGMTALNAVLLGRIPHRSLLASATRQDTSAALESLRQAGVLHAAQRDISTLSGGERQRVHIARALAQEPAVLVLDEPTTYLDVGAQLDVLRLLREVAARGVTVIAAIHELTLAADFCDRAIMLDRGRVRAAGQASEVLRPRLIAEVYGVRCRRLTDPATGESVLSFA
nr:ABC transporter ATP-binding protein [Rarobacter incanus]